jgi:two-component system nitrate/nitrite response regulator NarL
MSHARLILAGVNGLFREGLKQVLADDTIKIVGECRSLLDLQPRLRTPDGSADLIVYDLSEGEAQDFAVLKEVSQEFPKIGIVILADNVDPNSLDMAVDSGARGFLPKSISSTALRLSLKLILLGEDLFAAPASLSGRRLATPEAVLQDVPALRSPLSTREGEILHCLESGAPNKVIARQLDMAEATVKVHIKAVLRKINVSNRTQAAVWAMQQRAFTQRIAE